MPTLSFTPPKPISLCPFFCTNGKGFPKLCIDHPHTGPPEPVFLGKSWNYDEETIIYSINCPHLHFLCIEKEIWGNGNPQKQYPENAG